ncbi:MAG TPA: tRNA (adenosine(37)-N6)-threonylcarbamoyltransferase complex dimerization subunit type 1 TsaB [Burkholderiaceae bacterium]|nr:tRNA (adenosine(37)-N6)-threonylcarbamoyltransferase complex dimerization subunit type 1 TsaB [Burkholderiaceae bacterium]
MPNTPILLALDTATSVCSVALACDQTIHAIEREVGQRHTEYVLAIVDQLLASHDRRLADCDAIAFGAGPGSFTGLRVACGVAQGLAFGIDRPVIPVGNLAAGAFDAFARCPDARVALVAQDARMNEAYVGVYAKTSGRLDEVAAPALAAPDELLALAARHEADVIAGSAVDVFREQLQSFEGTRIEGTLGGARTIARLALEALAAGRVIEAAAAAPIYVRDRVALTVEQRRPRGGSSASAGA